MAETSTPETTPSQGDLSQLSAELRGLQADLDGLSAAAEADFNAAGELAALEEVRLKYLGKKGLLAELNRRFGALSAEEKPIAGKELNEHKARILDLFEHRRTELEDAAINARLETERVDVTLPGTTAPRGHLHPVVQVQRDVERIFRTMGFKVTESPEIESEWVNFEALNFPPNHPARDMQDTFFTERGFLLRTHTSGNQIRTMMNSEPPLAVISSGKVYRCDSDATHSPMFFQMEGYVVGRDISMAHLKGTLQEFLTGLFGRKVKSRFRPSFFPFTEPSAEMDIETPWAEGQWMEILGCGMIHPNVLRNCGIDPEKWSGFAFGMGLDRVAMLRYGITNIRLLFENDLRFLSQF